MLLFLKDQSGNLGDYLPKFQLLPIISYDVTLLKEKTSIVTVPCDKQIKELSFDFLFNYNFFPDNILTSYTEWNSQKRTIRIGDTIVQQIYFPPNKIASQKIIAGVRIKEVFKEDNLVGFSYETLKGHVEKGISSFQIYKTNDEINFKIHTYSKASNKIMDLFSPIFSSPYQDYCTNMALKQMVKLFKAENHVA